MLKAIKKGARWLKEKAVKCLGAVCVTAVVTFSSVVSYMKPAVAAIDLSDFSIDLTAIETIVPIILIGGAAMWVIRKLTKTVNKT